MIGVPPSTSCVLSVEDRRSDSQHFSLGRESSLWKHTIFQLEEREVLIKTIFQLEERELATLQHSIADRFASYTLPDSEGEQILLPVPEGALTTNIGLPMVVLLSKVCRSISSATPFSILKYPGPSMSHFLGISNYRTWLTLSSHRWTISPTCRRTLTTMKSTLIIYSGTLGSSV